MSYRSSEPSSGSGQLATDTSDDKSPGWKFDSADYELRWPHELVARELAAVKRAGAARDRRAWIERLLEEAFVGAAPAANYKACSGGRAHQYLSELTRHAPRLRQHHAPGAYWSARRGVVRRRPERSIDQLQRDFADLVDTLHAEGYLSQAFPTVCVDAQSGTAADPDAVLADRLGLEGLWPLHPATWDDEDVFFDLIEVFHDLVARPRYRHYHDWNDCGWHYRDFHGEIGRALYRWKVNTLLASGGLELRLADDGEDTGQLVRRVDDGRADLIACALASPEPATADRVTHAISLYRRRGADEHAKRSAVLTLAGVLEERRELIRSDIGRKDEGALFSIANEFAIRHQRRGQQGDYDPAFLDWMFWWYLATVELTDRLLARQATP